MRVVPSPKARTKPTKNLLGVLPLITWTLVGLAMTVHEVDAFGSFRVGWTTKPTVRNLPRQVTSSPSTVDELSFLDQDETSLATQFLNTFQVAWRDMTASELVETFFQNDSTTSTTPSPFWRDMVAFTWNIQTLEGSLAISKTLQHSGVLSHRRQSQFRISDQPLPPRQYVEKDQHILEFWSDLILDQVGTGKAHFRLVRPVGKDNLGQQTTINNSGSSDGNDHYPFKIHTLLTTLLELSDRPFRVGANRIRGHDKGAIPNRKYWPERLVPDENDNPYVLIIGGGQAGLALGARLHLLQIPYKILEAGPQPGTAWRKRYPSLHLHDPCWYNHMPYLPFPESWPVFCPRDKIADWLEFYAKAMDLNIQTNTMVTKVSKTNGSDDCWDVHIKSTEPPCSPSSSSSDGTATATTRTITAKHVVFATGNSSKPRLPKDIPGRFLGLQLHSSEYQGGRSLTGKKVAVLGSNNSGWDIVQDLWEQGAQQVTMIQRSPSMVVSTESVLTHGLGSLYYQDAPLSHEDADLVATATPYKLLLPRWKAINQRMKETDYNLLKDLSEAGYQLDDGPDGAGIFAKSATEGGGFYIDMGATDLIIRKLVQVRYATILSLEPDGLVIRNKQNNDEEKLCVDVLIYATGFETIDQWVAQLCGEDIATRVGRTWGLGLGVRPNKDPGPWEGELRNMWKPTPVTGLWFHGGNLAQSRHYSRFLALQLAARYMNIPTSIA